MGWMRSHRGASRASWMILAAFTGSAGADEIVDPPTPITFVDADYDVVVRRTDAGGVGDYDPAEHAPVELVEIRIGRWQATNPRTDLFTGQYSAGGGLLRLDVTVAGLHQPPGNTKATNFNPFAHGPDPIYGFIEIDVDSDPQTGGEIEEPQYRYLANIARFGGLPEGAEFTDRPALCAADLDGNLLTKPFVERHGEEFHLALLGDQFDPGEIEFVAGDTDLLFEPGETWNIPGEWFHRAHAFDEFTIAGKYAPVCMLRFSHDVSSDRTRLVLIFPMTNVGAAAIRGEQPQPNNHDPSDQASVNEALRDLIDSADLVAMFPTGDPAEQLILGWSGRGAGGNLQPSIWRLTALLGSSYATPGRGFVWTDAWPNPLRGNVDGVNQVDQADRDEISAYIARHDLDDGQNDDKVHLGDFAAGFSVFDLNHDGHVDTLDLLLTSAPGDADGDLDVDLADYASFQRCRSWTPEEADPSCGRFDLDGNGQIDERDLCWFGNLLGSPALP